VNVFEVFPSVLGSGRSACKRVLLTIGSIGLNPPRAQILAPPVSGVGWREHSARFVVPTVASSVDLVVHLGIDTHGVRRVKEIVAVPGRVGTTSSRPSKRTSTSRSCTTELPALAGMSKRQPDQLLGAVLDRLSTGCDVTSFLNPRL